MTRSVVIRISIALFALGCFVVASFTNLYHYWPMLLVVTILLIGGIVLFYKNKILRCIYLFAAALCIGALWTGVYNGRLNVADVASNDAKIQATVVAEPVIKTTYQQLIVKMQGGSLDNRAILVRAQRFPKFAYGDEVEVRGDISKPASFETDQGKVFDYANYLLMRYKVVGIIEKPRSVEKVGSNQGSTIIGTIYWIKQKTELTLSSILPEPYAALSQGLLTGTKANFTKSFEEALRRTGTSHIVAISGYNVTIILMVFFLLVRRSAGFYPAVVSGLVAVLIFTILTGANASIVRASIMGSLVIFARLFGRQQKIEYTLFVAALFMIIVNPLIVRFDAGFQLSFLAVLGLVYLSPKFEGLFSKIPHYQKLPAGVREALAATFGAQLMTLPVIIILFGQVSLIAPVTNAIILPLIPMTMALCFAAAVIFWVWPPLGVAAGYVAYLMLYVLIGIITIGNKVPAAALKTYDISPWWLLTWVIIVAAWIKSDKVKKGWRQWRRLSMKNKLRLNET